MNFILPGRKQPILGVNQENDHWHLLRTTLVRVDSHTLHDVRHIWRGNGSSAAFTLPWKSPIPRRD